MYMDLSITYHERIIFKNCFTEFDNIWSTSVLDLDELLHKNL